MSVGKAFVVFYVGVVVIITVLTIATTISPFLTGLVVALALAAFVVVFFIRSSQERARMIHRCFDMQGMTVRQTTVLIVVSSLVGPLYPVLALPLVALAALQMMRGKCDE